MTGETERDLNVIGSPEVEFLGVQDESLGLTLAVAAPALGLSQIFRIESGGHHITRDLEAGDLWAITPGSLDTEVAQRREHEVTRPSFLAEQPFKAGTLVVAKEIGGIDNHDTEPTAQNRSALRGIFAHRAGIRSLVQVEQAGVVHLIGEDLKGYLGVLSTYRDTLRYIPKEGRQAARKEILKRAVAASVEFLNSSAEVLDEAVANLQA